MAKQVTLQGNGILVIDKKDGKSRMCIDYYALNKIIIIKYNYLLHRIDVLLDRFNGAKYFNEIKFKSRSYQFCIMDEDVEKIAMKTRYGSYEFMVMPFGLYNTSSTFTTLMNFIFHEKLDKFMIIYIDDILMYSMTIEKHAEHL